MLQMRNTPDHNGNVSPSQIVFDRQLRDAFAFANRLEKFDNANIRLTWRDAWQKKEIALRQRFHTMSTVTPCQRVTWLQQLHSKG